MIDEIYSRDVLRHAASISRVGRLQAPDATGTSTSRICGSRVTITLNFEGGAVSDFAQQVDACVFGQAAAAILADNILGATLDELLLAREELRKMLKETGEAPSGRFGRLGVLRAVSGLPARHDAVLLPFDATIGAWKSWTQGAPEANDNA